jgi:hypothetical protein
VQGRLGDAQLGGGPGEVEVLGEDGERTQGVARDGPFIHNGRL